MLRLRLFVAAAAAAVPLAPHGQSSSRGVLVNISLSGGSKQRARAFLPNESKHATRFEQRVGGGEGGGVRVGEGARLRGVSHDCFLIFNLSNGPHLLYRRWSTERTPRGPKAALKEHMPTIAKFRSRSNFRRRVGRLIVAARRWTSER